MPAGPTQNINDLTRFAYGPPAADQASLVPDLENLSLEAFTLDNPIRKAW